MIKVAYKAKKYQKMIVIVGLIINAAVTCIVTPYHLGNILLCNVGILSNIPFFVVGLCSFNGKIIDDYIEDIKKSSKNRKKRKPNYRKGR